MDGLPPFPGAAGAPLRLPAALASAGITLRQATDGDLPALRRLYAETRAAEMAMVPWPPGLKQSFLDQQFGLQHRHYVAHFAAADFLVLESAGVMVGRLYLLRGESMHRVVDISLFEAWRGKGLGRALLEAVQAEAAGLGRGVALSVARDNPGARRLYASLGFESDGGSDTHEAMAWRPTA